MTSEKFRTVSHHEAHAWLEEVQGAQEDWINSRISTQEANSFLAWAYRQIQDTGDVDGMIDYETDEARDDASRDAYNAINRAQSMCLTLRRLFTCLAQAGTYGGDDLASVRRALVASEYALFDPYSPDQGRHAREIRGAMNVPTKTGSQRPFEP